MGNTFLNFLSRSSAEEKVSKLQEALEEVQHTHIKEVDEMNAQLERQRDRTEELTEAVSTLISFIFQNRLQFRHRY